VGFLETGRGFLIDREYIMDEISNYYGLWSSRLFHEEEGIIKYGV
jgi:hypothetical protein